MGPTVTRPSGWSPDRREITDVDSAPNWQFDWMAPLYDALSMEREWERLEGVLQPGIGGPMLDLGGGTGEVAGELSARFPRDRWVVLDRNRSMLLAGRTARPDRPFVQGDGLRMPFPPDVFERVFMGDAFHHVANHDRLLEEIRRVLHPGGSLVFEEFDPSRLAGRLLWWVETLTGMGSRFFRPAELSEKLEETGFVPMDMDRSGFVYYVRAIPGEAFAPPGGSNSDE